MSERSDALARRIELGARTLAEYAQGLTDTQWKTKVMPDGRSVGVIVHHVASVYPVEVHLASEVAAGRQVGVTWDAVAEMNAAHAADNAGAGKAETIALLLRNSRAAAESVRAFTDAQLDTAAPFSLNADAPLTAQFVIEDHPVRHAWHHLAKIRKATAA